MVRIRLRRTGSKKQPSYRIVVADSRRPRDGKYIEIIGWYNPRTEPSTEVVEEARALYWLGVGAQPSDSVARIFSHTGTMERFERLKAGENMEDLVQEAIENTPELPSPKTRHPSPAAGESKIKAKEAARIAAEEAEVAEAVEEVEAAAEEVVEEVEAAAEEVAEEVEDAAEEVVEEVEEIVEEAEEAAEEVVEEAEETTEDDK